jgi:hypothetical protein
MVYYLQTGAEKSEQSDMLSCKSCTLSVARLHEERSSSEVEQTSETTTMLSTGGMLAKWANWISEKTTMWSTGLSWLLQK